MRTVLLLSILMLSACAAPDRQCFVASMNASADNEPILIGRILPCDHIKVMPQ